MKRDISSVKPANGLHDSKESTIYNGNPDSNYGTEDEPLDMLIVGAGFAGVYLLHKLRLRGLTAKIVEVCPRFHLYVTLSSEQC